MLITLLITYLLSPLGLYVVLTKILEASRRWLCQVAAKGKADPPERLSESFNDHGRLLFNIIPLTFL